MFYSLGTFYFSISTYITFLFSLKIKKYFFKNIVVIPFEITAKLFRLFLILKSSGNFSLIVLMSNCGLEVNVLIIKKLVS